MTQYVPHYLAAITSNPEAAAQLIQSVDQALEGLGLVVRYDEHRRADLPRWTVAIAGVGRADAFSPREAGERLRRLLVGMSRAALDLDEPQRAEEESA